jgi:hypothetical protein
MFGPHHYPACTNIIVPHGNTSHPYDNKACRLFLGGGKYASNVALRGDLGWSSVNRRGEIEVFILGYDFPLSVPPIIGLPALYIHGDRVRT